MLEYINSKASKTRAASSASNTLQPVILNSSADAGAELFVNLHQVSRTFQQLWHRRHTGAGTSSAAKSSDLLEAVQEHGEDGSKIFPLHSLGTGTT
jgi:ABC-type sulfate transport system substrate-binding protein